MMAAAQAHQRASVYCFDKPDAKPPNIDSFFFSSVSFELILLSVEQSLRLLMLLHYAIIRDGTDHNPAVLYKAVRNKSGGKDGIRNDIIKEMNSLGSTKGIGPFSETDLVACLEKHNSSYANFRYFQLDKRGKLNKKWEIAPRDVQIMHCLAPALIGLNIREMRKRGIQGLWSMSSVPQSEMTPELKALVERLTGG